MIDRPAGNRRIYRVDPDGLARLRAELDRFWTKRAGDVQRGRRATDEGGLMSTTQQHVRPHGSSSRRRSSARSGLHRRLRPLQAARAQHARRRDRRDGVRAARRRPHLRPRRRRQRVPLGARARLRAAAPGRLQLGHQPALADRDRPERPARSRSASSPRAPERTRVELEHRNLDRHGEGWEGVREGVDGDGGWPLYLQRFAERLQEEVRYADHRCGRGRAPAGGGPRLRRT